VLHPSTQDAVEDSRVSRLPQNWTKPTHSIMQNCKKNVMHKTGRTRCMALASEDWTEPWPRVRYRTFEWFDDIWMCGFRDIL